MDEIFSYSSISLGSNESFVISQKKVFLLVVTMNLSWASFKTPQIGVSSNLYLS